MPIAFNAASGTGGDDTSASLTATQAHNCGTGENRILFVTTRDGSTSSSITGVTYAGVAMTKIGSGLNGGTGYLNLWYLLNPATGSNNIVVNRSATGTILWVGGASYTGVRQTGFPDASTTNSGTGVTSLSTSLTTVADNCWWVAAHYNHDITPVAGAGTTMRPDPVYGLALADGNGAKTPAGSVTSVFTASPAKNLYTIMVSFAPALSANNGNILFF